MSDAEEVEIEWEMEKILDDERRTMVRKLAEANVKLRELSRLQERVRVLEIETQRLRDEVTLLELEVDCCAEWDAEWDSDVVDAPFDPAQEYDPYSDADAWTESNPPLTDSESPGSEGGDEEKGNEPEESEGSIIPSHWLDETEDIQLPSKQSFLPADVLSIVFDFLLPDPEMVSHANLPGPLSPWSCVLRMKKSLARVCKTWHSVAVDYLYRDVVLRRMVQLSKFARTVSEDQVAFGHRVRRLTFSCLYPHGLTSDIQESIAIILDNCPCLEQLSFEGVQEMAVFGEEVILREDWDICTDVSRMAFIDATPTVRLTLRQLYIPSTTLRSIRLLDVCLWSEEANQHVNDIELPLLETLVLRMSALSCKSRNTSYHYLATWAMPSLKNVRSRPGITDLPSATTLEFFNKYGKQLHTLGFGPNLNGRHDAMSIEDVLQLSPLLKHIVYEPLFTTNQLPPIPLNKALTHVDLIVGQIPSRSKLTRLSRHYVSLLGLGWKSICCFERSLVEILPDLPYCSSLPRTRAEHDGKCLLDTYGYKIGVVPKDYRGMDVPELIFHEPYLDA